MKIKKVLDSVNVMPSKEELEEIRGASLRVIKELKSAIVKLKIDADVFMGGSYAKGTLARKERHDIDIYVRFGTVYDDLSSFLEKIVKKACENKKIKRVHGSRDYFLVEWNNKLYFEIIPVLRIKHPREARNVTDLSYFHVRYVKKKLKNREIAQNVVLAKTFMRAQKFYGAESYIQGFSGYAIECLIIKYGSFKKMLKELSSSKERIVLDPEKWYKNEHEILLSINESKLKSPVILVDPTWKERNVLAALSYETFEKFKKAAKLYLKNPPGKLFKREENISEKLKSISKKRKAQLIEVFIETDKQEGDIAGTKLKKFSLFLRQELENNFKVLETNFEYNEKQMAKVLFLLISKIKLVKIGPPIKLEKHTQAFRKAHKKTFVKDGRIHAYIECEKDAAKYLGNLSKKRADTLTEMHVTSIKVKRIV